MFTGVMISSCTIDRTYIDAFKLCNTVQRPFGRQVKDIGAWQKAMELLGIVGVMVNCALIGQS
ncbi:hypothetical protein DICVIV_14130, partial [Dictyocaulus viviparus]